jgi:hypothetical protein
MRGEDILSGEIKSEKPKRKKGEKAKGRSG